MSKKIVDTCAAGLPIPSGPCPYCGATWDSPCKLREQFTPAEIRENKRKAAAGEAIEI